MFLGINHSSVDQFGPLLRLAVQFQSGGVLCYLDSVKGLMILVSDWGTWAHAWGAPPAPLDVFLFDRGNHPSRFDYVARKLFLDRGDADVEYDEKTTKSRVRMGLAKAFRAYGARIRSKAAGATAQDFRSVCNAMRAVADATSFEELCENDDIIDWYTVDDEDRHVCPSREFLRVRDEMLPALSEAWKTWSTSR